MNDSSGSKVSGDATSVVKSVVDPGSKVSAVAMPSWFGISLGLVAASSLGLLALLILVLYEVFSSQKPDVVSLDLAKGQLLVGALTGVLTIAIAAGTIWYARLTHVLVSHAEITRSNMEDEIRLAGEQLRLTDISLRLANRPLLTDVPASYVKPDRPISFYLEGYGTKYVLEDRTEIRLPSATQLYAYLIVPLRNIGFGAAIIDRSSLTSHDLATSVGFSLEVVVPPGEITNIVFVVHRDDPVQSGIADKIIHLDDLLITVNYYNAQRTENLQTVFSLGKDPSSLHNMKVLDVDISAEV